MKSGRASAKTVGDTAHTSTRTTTALLSPQPAGPPRTALPYSHKASLLGATPPGSYAAAASRQRSSRIAATRRRQGRGFAHFLQRIADTVKGVPDVSGSADAHGAQSTPFLLRKPGQRSSSPTGRNGGDDGLADEENEMTEDAILTSMRLEETGVAGPLLPPLRAGQVIRDLPFLTQNGEVQFFSTHPSLLDEVFGLCHGQRVRFTRGAFSAQEATIVGVRGGSLWVLLESESIARELLLPSCYTVSSQSRASATYSSPQAHRHRTGDAVDAQLIGRCDSDGEENGGEGSLVAPSECLATTAVWRVRRELQARYGLEITPPTEKDGLPAEIIQAAEAQALRLFSPEQRAFLQCAPDLFVSVVDEDHENSGGLGGGGHSHNSAFEVDEEEEDFMGSGDGVVNALNSSPNSKNNGKGAEASQTVAASSRLSFYQQAVCASLTETERSRSSEPQGQSSHIAAESEGRVVFLTPRALTASGTLGWGGEGGVIVQGGGVHSFAASMSASIVV